MTEKRNNMNTLIDDAIESSLKFEKLMDKTDFDSWIKEGNHDNDDNCKKLEEAEQDTIPFIKFEENITELERICRQIKDKWNAELHNTEDTSSNEISLISRLFNAKIKRFEARICSQKENRKKKYKEALYHLLSALNPLQNPDGDNKENRWLILLYNDLSICYAGLENSSMSRGYAEEARNIIEEENSYKEFEKKFGTDNSTEIAGIANDEFVTTNLYALYTVALYNQAVAEKRSDFYSDAEKNFRKIKEYAEYKVKKEAPLHNFNYYSVLLNLGDIYIDLGRGKEAIELLDKALENKNKLDELDENDIRYWNVILARINALIDQTEYKKAKDLLCDKHIIDEHIINNVNTFTLNKKHRITSTGFKGLNCFVRCIIDSARNELKRIDKEKVKQAEKFINENKKIMKERDPEGSVLKAYRHLSNIYKILSEDRDDNGYDEDIINYLIKFISGDGAEDLKAFISNSKMVEWVDKCDDLDALESFTDQIINVIADNSKDNCKELLEKLKEKIINECEDKDQLHRAERIGKQIKEILGEEEDKRYMENFFKVKMKKIFPEESSSDKDNLIRKIIRKRLCLNEKEFDSIFPEGVSPGKENLSRKDICERLDINEKDFDLGFFYRSEMKEKKRIVEVIVLRRWNSFSPGLGKESTGSLGGGYLLRINKGLLMKKNEQAENGENERVENIVIDPGYNFMQSFRNEGFHVEDIDTIIITHSHLDHCAELLQIMDLLHQFNKRYKDKTDKERKRKKVNLCLSKGAYTKFSSFTNESWQKQLKDVIILENLYDNKCELFKGLTISAIPTPHMDLGGVNAIGLKIEIGIGKKKLCLGFTGDTPWSQEIREEFKGEEFDGCDLLCVHLGSIKYQEIGYRDDRYNLMKKPREISEDVQYEEFNKKYGGANHLLFFGTLDFIEHCSDKDEPLIIVGEFGEELKYGLRADLCSKISKEVNENRKEEKKKIVCLPGDIGLYIGIEENGTKKVRCNFCENFIKQKEIKTFSYGREDAIHYICETCSNTLTNLQKQAVIEHRVTRH